MVAQQENRIPLEQRISSYLSSNKPEMYVSEPSEEETLKAVLNMLERAEVELKAAQERVDNLKWKLALARSQTRQE